MEGHRLWLKHKERCDRSFILVLPQAAALLRQMVAAMVLSQHRVSSSRAIRPCTPYHAHCRLWGTLLRRGLRFVQWRRTRNPVKERDLIVHRRMELPKTSVQTIDLNPNCSKLAHSNRLCIGHGYESTEPRFILTVLCAPSVIRPLGNIRLADSI